MSTTRTRRPTGRLALALLLAAGLSAGTGAIAGAPAFASGEPGGEGAGSPGEGAPTGTSTTPTSSCPSPNPPNQLTLVAGTPQTALLQAAFATGLQVALTNSDGCAVTGVAGVPITFSAPANGASGRFSSNNSATATVGADASGAVAAPTFTANNTAGGYTVTASSQYGSVSFSLTNAANAAVGVWCPALDRRAPESVGSPAKILAGVGATQSARTRARFPIALAVTVTDSEGNPVAGAQVTFSAPAHGASGSFTWRTHDSRRRIHTVKVRTGACGIAVAPPFSADAETGGYIVKASSKPARPAAFALVNEASGQSPG